MSIKNKDMCDFDQCLSKMDLFDLFSDQETKRSVNYTEGDGDNALTLNLNIIVMA